MPIKININVYGPGRCIHQVMRIINHALQANNPNSLEVNDEFKEDWDGERQNEPIIFVNADNDLKLVDVSLNAVHLPWGG